MGYKTREWRKSMRVTLDYNNMTEKFLGDKGFSEKELEMICTGNWFELIKRVVG